MTFEMPAASSPTGMTLKTARSILELSSRLPGSETSAGTNNLSRVDYALKAAFDEYVRETKCTRTTNDTLTLTADSEDFSTAGVSNFDPSRIIRIGIEDPDDGSIFDAEHAGYDEVRQWRISRTGRLEWADYLGSAFKSGMPRVFGWRDASNAIVAPLPSKAWKVRLTYWETATSWTIGTSSPADVVLNIPEDVIQPVIQHGAAFYLHKTTHPAAAAMDRQLFNQHIADTRGFYAVTQSVSAVDEDYL